MQPLDLVTLTIRTCVGDPRPEAVADDVANLARIAAAGFNAVRVYEAPKEKFLDAARDAGLWVFVGLPWEWWRDFISEPSLFSAARVELVEGLQEGVQLPGIESQFAQRFREVIILLLKAFHDQPNFGQQNTNHVVTK